MVTREEAEVWAAAQPVNVVEPTPAEWFGYTVTEGEVIPDPPIEPPAGQQADEPDPAAPPAEPDPAAPPAEATITPAKSAKK